MELIDYVLIQVNKQFFFSRYSAIEIKHWLGDCRSKLIFFFKKHIFWQQQQQQTKFEMNAIWNTNFFLQQFRNTFFNRSKSIVVFFSAFASTTTAICWNRCFCLENRKKFVANCYRLEQEQNWQLETKKSI